MCRSSSCTVHCNALQYTLQLHCNTHTSCTATLNLQQQMCNFALQCSERRRKKTSVLLNVWKQLHCALHTAINCNERCKTHIAVELQHTLQLHCNYIAIQYAIDIAAALPHSASARPAPMQCSLQCTAIHCNTQFNPPYKTKTTVAVLSLQ